MVYALELTWNGGKGAKKEYQLAINRMGRASLGAFRFTPCGIIATESGFTPARALLNHRQARFAQRLHARPRDGRGPEEILAREGSALTSRIQAAAAIGRRGTAETQEWGLSCRFPGRIIVGDRAAALQTASEWRRLLLKPSGLIALSYLDSTGSYIHVLRGERTVRLGRDDVGIWVSNRYPAHRRGAVFSGAVRCSPARCGFTGALIM